ncbi:MAG: radical SAM protein [Patescibacteria group bacterium]|nr:radical SAM protein [Patescibacteria group bacterium]
MKLLKSFRSKDGKTIKYLQLTNDNHIIETGYYDIDEHIVCISSQIGCAMGCLFCATTNPDDSSNNKSFIRNLSSNEIIQQVDNILLPLKNLKKFDAKKILFSYMGMGEPFLNYTNTINSIKKLIEKFPNSRTTISTLGINPTLMRKLAHEKINTVLNLHLSLHAPTDALRKKILPKAQKIQPALRALKYFSSVKNISSKVNYVLIAGLNDSPKHAFELANLLKPYPFIIKLSNLNDFNNLKSSSQKTFNLFKKILNTEGIKTCEFISTGTDVKAGCGQLRRHYYNKNTK